MYSYASSHVFLVRYNMYKGIWFIILHYSGSVTSWDLEESSDFHNGIDFTYIYHCLELDNIAWEIISV